MGPKEKVKSPKRWKVKVKIIISGFVNAVLFLSRIFFLFSSGCCWLFVALVRARGRGKIDLSRRRVTCCVLLRRRSY